MRDKTVGNDVFYMWRAIFALAHVDHVVTDEERRFMFDTLSRVSFSSAQIEILTKDIEEAQDIGEMFSKINTSHARSQFFYFARMMVWCDGDYDEQEQQIMLDLKKAHVKSVDLEALVGSVEFQFNEEAKSDLAQDMKDIDTGKGDFMGGILSKFLKRFA